MQGPTFWFSIMGNGGPLCALAGVCDTSRSAARSPTETPPALVGRFGMVIQTSGGYPLISMARISMG